MKDYKENRHILKLKVLRNISVILCVVLLGFTAYIGLNYGVSDNDAKLIRSNIEKRLDCIAYEDMYNDVVETYDKIGSNDKRELLILDLIVDVGITSQELQMYMLQGGVDEEFQGLVNSSIQAREEFYNVEQYESEFVKNIIEDINTEYKAYNSMLSSDMPYADEDVVKAYVEKIQEAIGLLDSVEVLGNYIEKLSYAMILMLAITTIIISVYALRTDARLNKVKSSEL